MRDLRIVGGNRGFKTCAGVPAGFKGLILEIAIYTMPEKSRVPCALIQKAQRPSLSELGNSEVRSA